jgi:hypothetical protein
MTNQAKEKAAQQQSGAGTGAKTIDAVRHVGPTLESDPKQPHILETEQTLYEPRTPAERDLGGSATAGGSEQVPGHEEGKRVEPLHTRLAGDTSSDPHTDLGPDNATTVQQRPGR